MNNHPEEHVDQRQSQDEVRHESGSASVQHNLATPAIAKLLTRIKRLDFNQKLLVSLVGLATGALLIVITIQPPQQALVAWEYPLAQLGLTLCITSVLYMVFQNVFDRSNTEQVERIVSQAVGSVEHKVDSVNRSFEKVATQNDVLSGAFASNLIQIYPTRDEGLNDIIEDIKQSKNTRMIGISLRDYFMPAGRYSPAMDAILDEIIERGDRTLHALVINPHGDQATIRAEREECDDQEHFTEDNPYEDSGLFADLKQTTKHLYKKHQEAANRGDNNSGERLMGRVYNSAPSCFLVLTDKHTYLEQYHYGLPRSAVRSQSGLKGGHFPLMKFPTDSDVARHLAGHFDYVWQRQSQALSEHIDAQMIGVSKSAWDCKLMNLFPNRLAAKERIKYVLEHARGELRLIGISLRDFFHGGQDEYRIIKRVCGPGPKGGRPQLGAKALFLDPLSEQGRLRSDREEPGEKDGNMFSEVVTSLKRIKSSAREGVDITARLYRGSPSCMLILTADSVLVEQYHYGSDEPGGTIVGGKVPVLEYARDSQMYHELSGHFDFLWSDVSVSADLWNDEFIGSATSDVGPTQGAAKTGQGDTSS